MPRRKPSSFVLLLAAGLSCVQGCQSGELALEPTAATQQELPWSQQQKLLSPDPLLNGQLGLAVALSGDVALLGRPRGAGTGTAYAARRSGNIWAPAVKLSSVDSASGDRFGAAVAVLGLRALVGAPLHDAAAMDAGAVHVFEEVSGSFSSVDTLLASDAAAGDNFGEALALTPDHALVGAPAAAGAAGAVYVFAESSGSFSETKLIPASGELSPGDRLGTAVAIDAVTVVAGAPDDAGSGAASGAAYVFENTGGSWTETLKLTAQTPAAGEQFGAAVAVSGDTILVGAPGASGSGYVYVFSRSGQSWVQSDRFTSGDADPGDQFGAAVALTGTSAAVGAPGDKEAGNGSGALYAFVYSNGLMQQEKLRGGDAAAADALGTAVALDGDTALAGAPLDDDTFNAAGAAYVFTRPKSNGVSCSDGNECQSTHCVEGVCCDLPCDGTCVSCLAINKTLGGDGACGLVRFGDDPKSECPDDGPGSCKRDGTCDGAGACRLYAAGTECGIATCFSNNVVVPSCDGMGSCGSLPIATSKCSPYSCRSGRCVDPCTDPADCVAGHYCGDGTCYPKHPDGDPCAGADECVSGVCNMTCGAPPPQSADADETTSPYGCAMDPWPRPKAGAALLLALALLLRRRHSSGQRKNSSTSRSSGSSLEIGPK